MPRIISDTYEKGEKHIWDLDKDNPVNQEFNRKIIAVNDMYGWLYKKGILRDVSFEFKDYSDISFFALDVKDLAPYRSEMEQSGVQNASLAVQHIFDEEYTPCLFSGAIQLGWTMRTYRDIDGCVGRSWEIDLIQHLNNSAVHDILAINNEKFLGVRAAVSKTFELSGFEPDLFDKACEYYKEYVDLSDKQSREFFNTHADKLIYCCENKKDMLDFDFWVQYENLLDERITYDEYLAIDSKFDGDPHDVAKNDCKTISEFRNNLKEYRDIIIITQEEMDGMANRAEARLTKEAKKEFQSLADKIQVAETRLSNNPSVKEFVFEPKDYEKAKAALLSSGEDSMYWKNDGYTCFLELDDNKDIYYDLHLTRTGTTIMYGEVVELLSEESDCLNIRVPDSENEFSSISKEFFKKNFSPVPTPERGSFKGNVIPER